MFFCSLGNLSFSQKYNFVPFAEQIEECSNFRAVNFFYNLQPTLKGLRIKADLPKDTFFINNWKTEPDNSSDWEKTVFAVPFCMRHTKTWIRKISTNT